MRIISVLLAVAFLGVCGFALTYTEFKDYGMSRHDAEEKIFQAVSYQQDPANGFFVEKSIRETCSQIPKASRAAAVTQLGKLIRAYLESSDFTERYEAWLKQTYLNVTVEVPEDEREQIRASVEQEVSNYSAAILTQIVETSKGIEGSLQTMEENYTKAGAMTPEITMQLKTMRKRIDLAKEVDPIIGVDFDKAIRTYVAGEAKIRIEENEESKKKMAEDSKVMYEDRKNPKVVMARMVRNFLESTQEINYLAKTQEKNGIIYFVNAEYEKKPGAWKMGFRMGKEATEAARTFAQAWLDDLEK